MLVETRLAGTVRNAKTVGESILNIRIDKDKSCSKDLKGIRKSREEKHF